MEREAKVPTQIDSSYHLDGLKAIALIQIISYFCSFPLLTNGYSGVDVLLVLSGYLTTLTIVGETDPTLMKLYGNRAKKIYPVAMFVLIVTAVLYISLGASQDIAKDKNSFYGSCFFVENWEFLFSKEEGYKFANISEESPVFHFWMLAVDEQLTALWVVVLFAIITDKRKKLNFPMIVKASLCYSAVVVIVSYIVSSTFGETHVFFGTWFRSYQVIAGATVGLLQCHLERDLFPDKSLRKYLKPLGSLLSWSGLLGVIAIAFKYFEHLSPVSVSFFSAFASFLLLVGFTVTGKTDSVKRILSSSILCELGKISLHVYLWSFPVVVFGSKIQLFPVENDVHKFVELFVILSVSVFLGSASWFLFGKKLDFFELKTNAQQKSAILLSVIAIFLTFILLIMLFGIPTLPRPGSSEGIKPPTSHVDALAPVASPVPSPVAAITHEASKPSPTPHVEDLAPVAPSPPASPVPRPPARQLGHPPLIYMIGDSFVNEWSEGMKYLSETKRFTYFFNWASACAWFDLDKNAHTTNKLYDCTTLLHDIETRFKEYYMDLTIVVNYSLTLFDIEPVGSDVKIPVMSAGWLEYIENKLRIAIPKLKTRSKQVALMLSHAIPMQNMAVCVANIPPEELKNQCDSPAQWNVGQKELNGLLIKLAAEYGVKAVSITELCCPGDICPAKVDGLLTFRDLTHLTPEYAKYLSNRLYDLFLSQGIDLSCPGC